MESEETKKVIRSRSLSRPGCTPYIVKKEDTLAGIALAHGVSLPGTIPVATYALLAVLQANHLLSSPLVYPGQTIYVPTPIVTIEQPETKDATPLESSPEKKPVLSSSSSGDRSVPSESPEASSPPSAATSYSSPLKDAIRQKVRANLESAQKLFGLWSSADKQDDSSLPPVVSSSKPVTFDSVIYISNQCIVKGTLTISPSIVLFEPNESDPQVIQNGIQSHQVALGMSEIYECKSVTKAEMDSAVAVHVDNASSTKKFLQISFLHEGEQNGKCIYFQIDYDIDMVAHNINQWILQYQRDVLQAEPHTTDVVPTQSITMVNSPSRITSHVRHPSDYVPPHLKDPSDILTDDDVLQLSVHLPARHSTSDWTLLYAPNKHGYSTNTMYTRLKDKSPTVLVLKDSNDYVFGAFVPEAWRSDHQGYYGNGQTFVFRLKPAPLSVYCWSQLNNYFQLSSLSSLSIGGGGTYGIWIDKDMLQGSSSPCSTFLNPVLSSANIFKLVYMEIWGV